MKVRKNNVKVWSLVLLVSMMLSLSGCGVLLNSLAGSETEQKVPEIGEATENATGDTTQDKTENSQDTEGNGQESTGPSSLEEELMSDYFVGKMELLATVIDQYYMNDISVEDMRIGAYKGLMEGLGDPYTCYYTKEEYDDLMEATSGTYSGIGAVVQQDLRTMYITIVKPYVDGPAYNAGMLPGDIIYMVDDVDVTGMEVDKVVTMMKGPEGTNVKVTVVRDGVADPVDLYITRATIEIETVEYEMLADNLGYILVSSFDEPTAGQFKAAIEDLQSQGMKGLVIELRDNPGGLLSSVVEMLDYILPKGLIVYTEDKYGQKQEYRGTDADVLDMPMTVMINGNSASAAEIFAAAMQDYEAATLVGTTSYGKGIVQSVIPFTDGTAVKITVSRYFTPNGVCIHGEGVTPDIEVELAEELKQMVVIPHDQDNQLAVAIAVLLNETLK